MSAGVDIQGISKAFEKLPALENIDLSVSAGELFGLIGSDGAGKTTLFRILTTLLLPDEGKARVAGYDLQKDHKTIRRIVGYMPGRFSLYQDLSVQENLEFFATIFGTTIEQNYDLIRDIYVQIEPFRTRRASKLSGGMKQKLALCCALIHRPQVLFLDEPTTGVDAVSRDEFWDMLARIQKQGITILVSTPYMDEAGRCDRIALIQEGKVVALGTPQSVAASYSRPLYEVMGPSLYQLLQTLRQLELTDQAVLFGDTIHLSTRAPLDDAVLQSHIAEAGGIEASVRRIEATVEDVFIDVMG